MHPHIILQVSTSKLDELIEKIKFLKGVYTSELLGATHLICEELNCSELFLEACAKGLWILSIKFVEDSFDLGIWLKEDNYEHSSDSCENLELMVAAKSWRWKISLFQEPPFSGWDVAVDNNMPNGAFFIRLLKHGGAQVFVFKLSPQLDKLANITYIFLDSTNAQVAKDLIDHGFLCLHPNFIIDTVIKDAILDPFDYLICNTINPEVQGTEDSTRNVWNSEMAMVNGKIHLPQIQNARKSVRIETIPRSKQINIQEIVCGNFIPTLINMNQDKKITMDKNVKQLTKCKVSKDGNQDILNGALAEVSNIIAQQSKPLVTQSKQDRNVFESLGPSFYLYGASPSKSVISNTSSPKSQKSLLYFGFDKSKISRFVTNNKLTTLNNTFLHKPATKISVSNDDENVIIISDDDVPVETVNLENKKIQSTKNSSLLNYVAKTEMVSDDDTFTAPSVTSVPTMNKSFSKRKKRIRHKNINMKDSGPLSSPANQHKVKTSLSSKNSKSSLEKCFLTWPLSFSVARIPSSTGMCKTIHSLYGELMNSARELDFPDVALIYAAPSSDHAPQPLLIRELLYLLQSSDLKVACKANTYLQAWLHMHPPTTTKMIKCYKNAFHLYSDKLHFFEIIQSECERRNYVAASWILQYIVTLFEVNWIHCLEQGTKEAVQNSMLVSWLWQSPYVVQHGATTNQLLKLLETCVLISDFKFSMSRAVLSLIAIAAECIRLVNVKWALDNSYFVMDPVISLAGDLTKKLRICFVKTDFETMIALVMCIEPSWFRTLVVSMLLSECYAHFLIEKFQVKYLSWSTIIHHFLNLDPTVSNKPKAVEQQLHDQSHTHNLAKKANTTHNLAKKANKPNAKGESAVHIACKRNNAIKLQELLLIPGVNVNLKDNAGWTPLHEACNRGNLDCVCLLLRHSPLSELDSKTDINASGPGGITPLMDAVINKHKEVCRELLKFGGKVLLLTKSDQGHTALDFADSEEMKTILKSTPDSLASDDTPSSNNKAVFLSYQDCTRYLALLTILLTSYQSCQLYLQQCCFSSLNGASKDTLELQAIGTHIQVFREGLAKLTTSKDYMRLKGSLLCLELLCDSLI
ncbi:hypothetical protein BgiMline_014560 [Biomphalaria glabrata]|nr:SMC5-SMC6 complex localization factor protein 1-like isoform X1 [Biomphalaria glabrata]